MKHNKHPTTVRGFTVIELSIVLVIIGLIAGGVLVARDLIEIAKARSYMQGNRTSTENGPIIA